jgi:hypothetical protein
MHRSTSVNSVGTSIKVFLTDRQGRTWLIVAAEKRHLQQPFLTFPLTCRKLAVKKVTEDMQVYSILPFTLEVSML